MRDGFPPPIGAIREIPRQETDKAGCAQMQPPIMPRDDLAALNVAYRRIPVMTVGRDVLLDTRLILQVLERRFPDGALGGEYGPEQRAIRRLLERWTADAGVFQRAVQLIPTSLPNMRDPAFVKDRSEMGGQQWSRDKIDRARPEAMVHVRDAFELLESTVLSDGRKWIFGTEKPGLADIEGE
jgi:glutathione S-transferase